MRRYKTIPRALYKSGCQNALRCLRILKVVGLKVQMLQSYFLVGKEELATRTFYCTVGIFQALNARSTPDSAGSDGWMSLHARRGYVVPEVNAIFMYMAFIWPSYEICRIQVARDCKYTGVFKSCFSISVLRVSVHAIHLSVFATDESNLERSDFTCDSTQTLVVWSPGDTKRLHWISHHARVLHAQRPHRVPRRRVLPTEGQRLLPQTGHRIWVTVVADYGTQMLTLWQLHIEHGIYWKDRNCWQWWFRKGSHPDGSVQYFLVSGLC